MFFSRLKRWLRRIVIGSLLLFTVIGVVLFVLMIDRPELDTIEWQSPLAATATGDQVSVTWLGVSSLLIDDGDTQILIDGFISRPSLLDLVLHRQVDRDIPIINKVIHDFEILRLAAIVPVHSHFDHAMDIGAFANRSSASIVGSLSSLNIARGDGVPEDQLVLAENGARYEFGEFSLRMIENRHAPLSWKGAAPYPGTIDEPLQLPAPVSAWREGGSYSLVISHPQGTLLVQGSAGCDENALAGVNADVVFLGVGGLSRLGRENADTYWQRLVTATGVSRVIPIHFDDFTQPFGQTRLAPRFIDDFLQTAVWLEEFRNAWDRDVTLFLPAFGEPIAVFAALDAAAEPSAAN